MNTRKLQQCNRCYRQTSMTAGTIFEVIKLPLTVWFQGLYFMTQDKIRCIDDAYLGGERSGGKRGRGHRARPLSWPRSRPMRRDIRSG